MIDSSFQLRSKDITWATPSQRGLRGLRFRSLRNAKLPR